MKKGIKALFVYPNPTMDNLIPIGVSLLSACLKKAGHQTKLFDTTFYDIGRRGDIYRERSLQTKKIDLKEWNIKRKSNMIRDFRKTVENYKPDLVALSIFEVSYKQGMALLKSIKDFNIPTIVGGVHTTFSPDEVIRKSYINMVCVGEGEDALVELADRMRDGKSITDVRNLWVKKDGKVIKNDLRPLKNLDELPFQDWTIYEKERLYKPMLGKIRVSGAFETTRGCVYNCGFCCNPAFRRLYSGKGRFYREKSIEKVIDEVRYFKEKYNLTMLKFIDANFLFMSDERFHKFIELYRKVRVPFWAYTRADTVTEEKIKLMESVGCRGMGIGLESGNKRVRNMVLKKGLEENSVINAFKVIKKYKKIKVWTTNIIGFPTEGRKEIFDTIELNRKINPPRCSVYLFSPYRGTELRDVCVKEGYMAKNTIVGDFRGEYVLNMPQITKDELLGLQRTFLMYVRFPKRMYPLIRKAETSDKMFEKLSKIYAEKYL